MIGFRKDGDRILVSVPYDPKFTARAKELGGKWSREEKVWKFPNDPDVAKAVENLIQEVYGVDIYKPLAWAKITYTGTDPWQEEGKPVTVGGAELAIARGRDSGARVGENVFLLDGKIDSGGSMKHWTSFVGIGSVFKALIYRDSAVPEGWEVKYLDDEVKSEGEGGEKLSSSPAMGEVFEGELRKKGDEALNRLLFQAKAAAKLPDGWIEAVRQKFSFIEQAKMVIWIEFVTGSNFSEEDKITLREVMRYAEKHGWLPS